MHDCDPAQAAELVRALRDHLREMTHRLAWVDGRDVPGTNGHPTRLEAAALRRDIAEAKMHIDRLLRRYFSGRRAHPTASSRRAVHESLRMRWRRHDCQDHPHIGLENPVISTMDCG